MKNMCGIKKYVALSGLVLIIYILTQDFDSLRPELLHCGALPLLFRSNYLNILKGFNVKVRGGVKRNSEIKYEAKIRAESPICFIDTEFVRFKTLFYSFQINKTVFK